MTDQLTFWTWLKWGYLSQGIEVAVMAVGLYCWQRYKKRRKPKLPELPENRCSTESCRLGAGHVMSCWDGTPDPNYKARTERDNAGPRAMTVQELEEAAR